MYLLLSRSTLSKHFCWPPLFMKNRVLWPEAIIQHASAELRVHWRRCKAPLWGPGRTPRGNFGYFNDPRVSNSFSMHHSVTRKIIYNDRIIAQKRSMFKQGTKTINAEFIWRCELSQLFFVQFSPYVICSVQILCNQVPRGSSVFNINVKK